MSLNRSAREAVKHYVLEQIAKGHPHPVQHTAETFSISETAVRNYLKKMMADQIVYRQGRNYCLSTQLHAYRYDFTTLRERGEDAITQRDIDPHLTHLPENVRKIWYYAATEMLNNALDHAKATYIMVIVAQTYMDTTISVIDDGIGIFQNIKDYFELDSLDSAIMELFMGKLTTNQAAHSGEGIFFTSRLMDAFGAVSDGKIFTHNNYEDVQSSYREETTPEKGTLIVMKLSNFSKKNLTDVFSAYENQDGEFAKTSIPLKNIYSMYPVSRSQAKRLSKRFSSFAEVTLDFAEIDQIGQGFAHELFVVYQHNHPEVTLVAQNANDHVQRMIRHVLSS